MRAWTSRRRDRPLWRYPKRRVLAEPPRHAHYLVATRHAWPCLLFLLPLLIAYEVGVFWVGGTQPEALRNGADTWLRWGLDAFGLHQLYWAPVLVVAVFVTMTCVTCLRPAC